MLCDKKIQITYSQRPLSNACRNKEMLSGTVS